MIYFAIGAVVLVLLIWAGRGGLRSLSGGGMRITAGVLSTLMLFVAGFLALRGGWIPGLILAALSMGGAFAARGTRQTMGPPPRSDVGLDEARSILGVRPNATDEEIQAAYTRLMRMAHPDKGGTSGLASQLNAARDRLLGR
jgi:hypothetical protein